MITLCKKYKLLYKQIFHHFLTYKKNSFDIDKIMFFALSIDKLLYHYSKLKIS